VAHSDTRPFIEDERHPSRTVFAEPEKFQAAQGSIVPGFLPECAATVQSDRNFSAEKLPGMEVAEGNRTIGVGAFRNHIAPPSLFILICSGTKDARAKMHPLWKFTSL
jgi:hypothetical protein